MGRSTRQLGFALKLWPLTHLAKRIIHLPPFRWPASLFASRKAFRGSFIPVGEAVDLPPGVVAPREVLIDFLQRASHLVIVHSCVCRCGEGCTSYPADLACLLLGEGSRQVDPGMGRPVSSSEAAAHLDRAIETGLLPMLGYLRVDRVIYGVKGNAPLLTICFCCECCCVLRSGMKNLTGVFPGTMERLKGISVLVGGGCTGCGCCLGSCPVDCIEVREGIARIKEACLGCGACARACPRDVIRVEVSPDAEIYRDLDRRIEVWPALRHD